MASPRRRRLRKLLRAGLLKTAGAVEAAVVKGTPKVAPKVHPKANKFAKKGK